MTPFTRLVPGYPSRNELTRVRHRLSLGESIESIAMTLGRTPQVLRKFLALGMPKAGRPKVSRTFAVQTKSGAKISGLTFSELEKLLPIL